MHTCKLNIIALSLVAYLLSTTQVMSSEFSLWKLSDGNSFKAKPLSATGSKIVLKKQDGKVSTYDISELSSSSKSKLEKLRRYGEITHSAQHVLTKEAQPNRMLIPSYHQKDFSQPVGCGSNAAINFLLWWDRIGICTIPEEGSEYDKAKWLHRKFDHYIKTDDNGTFSSLIIKGLKKYFEEYPSENYTFEYEILPLSDPTIISQNATGLNATVLLMSRVKSGRRKFGHFVSVLQATKDNSIVYNTYGSTFSGQLFEPSDILENNAWELDINPSCQKNDSSTDGKWCLLNLTDVLIVVKPIANK